MTVDYIFITGQLYRHTMPLGGVADQMTQFVFVEWSNSKPVRFSSEENNIDSEPLF